MRTDGASLRYRLFSSIDVEIAQKMMRHFSKKLASSLIGDLLQHLVNVFVYLLLIALIYFISLRLHRNLFYLIYVAIIFFAASSQLRRIPSKKGLRYPLPQRCLFYYLLAFIVVGGVLFQLNYRLSPSFYMPGTPSAWYEWVLFLVKNVIGATFLDLSVLGFEPSSIRHNPKSLISVATIVSFQLMCTILLLVVLVDYVAFFKRRRNVPAAFPVDSIPAPVADEADSEAKRAKCYWISVAHRLAGATIYDVTALYIDLESGRLSKRDADIYYPRCMVQVPLESDGGTGPDSFFYWASRAGAAGLIMVAGRMRSFVEPIGGFSVVRTSDVKEPSTVYMCSPDKLRFGVGYSLDDVLSDFRRKFPVIQVVDAFSPPTLSRERIKIIGFADAGNKQIYVREVLNPESYSELLFALGHDRRRNWILELCMKDICICLLDMYHVRITSDLPDDIHEF